MRHPAAAGDLGATLRPPKVIARLEADDRPIPRMLGVLRDAGAESFYRGVEFLGLDGAYHPVPGE